jgi:glycosyltransferase involved in cell wall biosynthesis
MRFHVIGLPHTKTKKDYCACAYTQKVLNFCKMMISLGHTVFEYSAQGSQAECTEHIDIISNEEQEKFFGATDWKKNTFPIEWDVTKIYWRLTNQRAAEEINKRKQRQDFVCIVGGNCQKPLFDLVGEELTINVEPFVGYAGIFCKYRVFESYSHQAFINGTLSHDPDFKAYDAVIPNYFDPADFQFGPVKKDYLLYIGRLIQRKGLQVVLEIAKRTDLKVILAGQGVVGQTDKLLKTEEGIDIPLDGNISYVGYADVALRSQLMREAKAVLMPTSFLEPFGGVAVEAQMCGTPVITTDHAVFHETIKHGVTGWRCHTLEHFMYAVNHLDGFNYKKIRKIAIDNYSIDKVKYMYQEYFQQLLGLWGPGWYDLSNLDKRTEMNWLNKT